ncbi:dihydrofolate reductase [Gracilibacillus boraciitolerans JCM 21714]|uniref:Dihydrofolate reductase n=1 Tax=Gracilibacillus boraciitolerans JCM 21714 TaxID=1298598 RepID=W4VDG3_9BACI|nr:dihydrofolate reductase [Gracilibacillus boraciitolerans]GAE91420.1 dihydrofolate reductase [Gracilibacillus boraciitolerans JCM 21714]
MISLLFAMDKNRVIGKDNRLPWHLPSDLKFFKKLTTGQSIIMGRKTFESMNGPLSNRDNIVLTSKMDFNHEHTTIIHSIDKIKELNNDTPEKEWFVIGGGEEIFKQVLSFADRMYMTYIDEVFEGDTFFPNFNEYDWKITSKNKGTIDEKNKYDHYFIQYDRIKSQ